MLKASSWRVLSKSLVLPCLPLRSTSAPASNLAALFASASSIDGAEHQGWSDQDPAPASPLRRLCNSDSTSGEVFGVEQTKAAQRRPRPFWSSESRLRRLKARFGRTQLYPHTSPNPGPGKVSVPPPEEGKDKIIAEARELQTRRKLYLNSQKSSVMAEDFKVKKIADHYKRRLKSHQVNAIKEKSRVSQLTEILQTTKSADEAWDAFKALLALERDARPANDGNTAPPNRTFLTEQHLTRIASLLTRARPHTRPRFLRLLAVLARLRKTRADGALYVHEWNALINLAGRGWRHTTLEAYGAALDVFNDMQRASGMGTNDDSDGSGEGREIEGEDVGSGARGCVKPDIVTYTTLLNIAARTRHESAINHATALLHASGLPLSRVTHLASVRYRRVLEGMPGVRDVYRRLESEGHALGVDGVNAFLWSVGREGEVDIALNVYRVLRKHITKDSRAGESDGSAEGSKHLTEEHTLVEGLTIPKSVVPDEVTYTSMIQTLAYHGYLLEALQVLTDMLSTALPPPRTGAYQPTLPVFRSLFCAYAKHGHTTSDALPTSATRLYIQARQTAWNWETLQILLHSLLQLPVDVRLSERTVYWVMAAVEKVTGKDREKGRAVWAQLNERFEIRVGGRLGRLAKVYGGPESRGD